jgi:6-pyruvoyltetrahydropterin/6-carboxytetrahydropterin synthase
VLFTVSVKTHFQSLHRLVLPDGLKERLHSHNWSVIADVSSDRLNNMGLVMDFRRLKTMIDNIVAGFDGLPLDSIDYFQQNNSSAENLAKYIYEKLEPKLPKGVKLNHVRIVEEPDCSAKFGK